MRLIPFLIYHSHNVTNMEQRNNIMENLCFADLIETSVKEEKPTWNQKFTTSLAHPSGRIPSRSAAVGWQPIYIPGVSRNEPIYSSTLKGLVRRVRITRGEA